MKTDIEYVMRASNDFKSFTEDMNAAGYRLVRNDTSKIHGHYVTYLCPDGEKRVRDYILGADFTIQSLEDYWKTGI